MADKKQDPAAEVAGEIGAWVNKFIFDRFSHQIGVEFFDKIVAAFTKIIRKKYAERETVTLARITELEKENDGLNRWVADLQDGMYVNCIYCGHRYPPGVPESRDKNLYEHIKKCPKHPLSHALIKLIDQQAALSRLVEAAYKATHQLISVSGSLRLAHQMTGNEQGHIINIDGIVAALQQAIAEAKKGLGK